MLTVRLLQKPAGARVAMPAALSVRSKLHPVLLSMPVRAWGFRSSGLRTQEI